MEEILFFWLILFNYHSQTFVKGLLWKRSKYFFFGKTAEKNHIPVYHHKFTDKQRKESSIISIRLTSYCYYTKIAKIRCDSYLSFST